MALNYYIDPATGRRTTRDALVHRRTLAARRVMKWAAVYEDATDRFDRARTKRTQEKYRLLANHAARYEARAERDRDAYQDAIDVGDGPREYRYRWSVSYTTRKKDGATDRVQVDVLFYKRGFERASAQEVDRMFRVFWSQQGTPPDPWRVKYVTWYHEAEGERGRVRKPATAREQVRVHRERVWPEGIVPFRHVINAGRPDAVIGEERRGDSDPTGETW